MLFFLNHQQNSSTFPDFFNSLTFPDLPDLTRQLPDLPGQQTAY